MQSRPLLLASLVASFAIACTQEPAGTLLVDTSAGANGTGAKGFFLSKVFPELDKDQGTNPDTGKLMEGCVRCHSVGESGAPIWLAATAEAAYDAVDGYESPYGSQLIALPANSELLLHGEHTGPALTSTQQALVKAWLELEVEERGLAGATTTTTGSGPGGGGGPPPPTKTVEEALLEWGDCMSLDDWTEAGMHLLYNAQTVGSGQCSGCHSTGQAGAFLSDNTNDTFAENRKKPYMLKHVVGKVGDDGNFQDLVPSDRFVKKGTETCTVSDTSLCHPVYALDTDMQNALKLFFQKTYDRWKTTGGTCTPGGMGGGGGGGGEGGLGGAGGAGGGN